MFREILLWNFLFWNLRFASVEDEKELAVIPLDLNQDPGASIVLPPEVSNNINPCYAEVLWRNSTIRDRSTHLQLKKDLVEHVWCRFGNS